MTSILPVGPPLSSFLGWKAGTRLLLLALLLLVSNRADAAPPADKEKVDNKQDLAQFRAYLPAIRAKALRDNERQHVLDLDRYFKLSQAYLEGGLYNQVHVGQIEQALLQANIRRLERERKYRDAVDDYVHRFPDVPAERRQQMEKKTLAPLTDVFRGFEQLSRDWDAAGIEFLKQAPRDEKVTKLRPVVIGLATTSTLVKDTKLPQRFRTEWARWDGIEFEKQRRQLDQILQELRKLRLMQAKEESDPKRQPRDKEQQIKKDEANRQKVSELFFQRNAAELEQSLRSYEQEPWKDLKDKIESLQRQVTEFRSVGDSLIAILTEAKLERQFRLSRSLPALPSLKLKDVDLLLPDEGKVEQCIVSWWKTNEEQLAGRKKVRRLRALAAEYDILHRSFELAFARHESLLDKQRWPAPSDLEDKPTPAAPVAPRPSLTEIFDVPTLLDAYRSLAQAKRQFLLTWIDYQMVRLDLFHDLGLTPPER